MTLQVSEQSIIDQMRTHGLISDKDIERIKHQNSGRLQHLINGNQQLSQQLEQFVSDTYKLPFVRLDHFKVDAELFGILPVAQAMQLQVLPYQKDGNTLKVITATPLDMHLEQKLESLTGLNIQLLLSTTESIQQILERNEGNQHLLDDVSDEFKPLILKENSDGVEELVSLETIDADTAPVIRLVNSILLAALQRRASDIHIEVYEQGVEVKYRIDGVLYPATATLDLNHHAPLISRLKVMAELDIAEKRIPQDGRFKLRLGQRDIDFRVSILPSVFGEDVVIRILDKHTISDGLKLLSLNNLGLNAEVLKTFRKAIREPYGMVLMTGPTGSGKTTTLYAALNELNTGEEKIITIEDPVEYQLNGITQMPVNEKKGVSFAKGLRSILRHDPDKIMVGEIRDVETAQIAVQSALTGHLVFTTVHANNAFDVISRFSHMGVDVYSFISSLNCVIAQRLIRKICNHCKQQVHPDVDELERSGFSQQQLTEMKFHEGTGCERCHQTGYYGRVAITELLDLSPRIRQMIIDKEPVLDMQTMAKSEGMISLRESAVNLVIQGITSLKEINRVTFVD